MRLRKILLTKEFFLDLGWFDAFLTQYNAVTYYHQSQCHSQMHLDAFLTGLGAVFHNMVYSLPLPRGYMGYTIVHLEILNIVVACKVWANYWASKRIQIWCDNQAVVEVLTTGKCKDKILAVCARNIWLISAIKNFQINAPVPPSDWPAIQSVTLIPVQSWTFWKKMGGETQKS